MQSHVKVVSLFLKTCVKIVEIVLLDCWNRKKDLISMYRGTLVSGFANISVYFNKLANNFMKPLDKCFKRIKILLVILLHEKFLPFDWLRAVVFQLNLKYFHVKITNLLRVVV